HSIDDEDQLTLADSICRHVHNHPLHIQLAAARRRRPAVLMLLEVLTRGAPPPTNRVRRYDVCVWT
ncbi:hypothetical protein, partial [Nocardia brasiliensis]|uniref:hypothetical protein n=1 Tax=Nocardia brasiliensis TaxID=37326 RepID=UPI0024588F49